MKIRFALLFILMIATYISIGQNCGQEILSRKLVGQSGLEKEYELTFQNHFQDSLLFILVPNDAGLLKSKSLDLSLVSDSICNISRDSKDALHLLNFISLKPEETFMIDLKVDGDFGLALTFDYYVVSKNDYLENQQIKIRESDRYRKELDFITNHNACKGVLEILKPNP